MGIDKKFRLSLFALLMLTADLANANMCESLMRNHVHIADWLRGNDVEGGWLKHNGQKVPILFVRHDTNEEISDFFSNSVSVVHQCQPLHTFDHGLIRVGETLMDCDTPGKRYFGEINQTGIAAYDVIENLRRKLDVVETRVEYVLFPKKEHFDAMNFYHRVRRAAILRIPNTFDQDRVNCGPNLLREANSEHCFIFSKSQTVMTASQHILQRIDALAPGVITSPLAQAFIAKTKAYILRMKIDLKQPHIAGGYLNPGLILQKNTAGISFLDELRPALPTHLSEDQQLELGNWLIAYEAVRGYRDYIETLPHSSSGLELGNHFDAIIIHDNQASNLSSGRYTSKGRTLYRQWEFEPWR